MSRLRYSDLHPREVLSLTSLTVEEFEGLLPRFEKEFQFYMSEWTLEGKPREKRSYSTYRNCPLPTPADRLLFVLIYFKNNPVQALHGKLFGLPQGKTNMWLAVLMPVLRQTLGNLGESPARSVQALAERLEVLANPPLFAMTERRDRLSVPLRISVSSTVGRKSATR